MGEDHVFPDGRERMVVGKTLPVVGYYQPGYRWRKDLNVVQTGRTFPVWALIFETAGKETGLFSLARWWQATLSHVGSPDELPHPFDWFSTLAFNCLSLLGSEGQRNLAKKTDCGNEAWTRGENPWDSSHQLLRLMVHCPQGGKFQS